MKQCGLGVLLKVTNILMPPRFQPSIAVSRNRHLTYMTNLLLTLFLIFQLSALCNAATHYSAGTNADSLAQEDNKLIDRGLNSLVGIAS